MLPRSMDGGLVTQAGGCCCTYPPYLEVLGVRDGKVREPVDVRLAVEQHVPVVKNPAGQPPWPLPPVAGHLLRQRAH